MWRRVAEMGQDAEERTCDSPQLLVPAGDLHHPDASLSASAPSSSAVPPARPSPTQQHAADASTLLIRKASSIHGGSVPFLSSLRQPCPGSPLSSSSPFPQQGQPHPQPHWAHLGLPQLEPNRNRGHCQSPTAPQPLPCTCPQPGALHPGAANTARGTEEAGKVSSLRHIGNPGSALATRLSAQRQQDRGRKGKRKAGGRTEGGRGVGQGAGKRDAANQRGTGSRTRG